MNITKHLFIINPAAKKVRSRLTDITSEIHTYFRMHPQHDYDLHITRWCRDATSKTRQYAEKYSNEPVRIHSIGGSATLLEVVSGAADFPKTEIAAYPFGISNCFLRYFAVPNDGFTSIHEQVNSDTLPFDVIQCGNNHAMSFVSIGACARGLGQKMIERDFPIDLSYAIAELYNGITQTPALYDMVIDGERSSKPLVSIFCANAPCCAKNLCPALEAHPNDGKLEIYQLAPIPPIKFPICLKSFANGNYQKYPNYYTHKKCTKIELSSSSTMCIIIDGETYYTNSIKIELKPASVNLVVPKSVNIGKIPGIYKKVKNMYKDPILSGGDVSKMGVRWE